MSKNPWGDSTGHTRRPNTSASRIFDAAEYTELEPDAEFTDSAHANTSPFPSSSPSPPHPNRISILDFEFSSDIDSGDENYGENTPHPDTRSRAPRQSQEAKVLKVLEFFKAVDPRLSLRLFLVTLFESDTPELKKIANLFHSEDGSHTLLDIWARRMPEARRASLDRWAIFRAAGVCERSASFLTDEAAMGPFKAEADFLRMPASTGVSVRRFRDFSMEKLGAVFDSTMEPLQVILKAVIGKEGEGQASGKRSRNPKHARIFVTSILLNLRSRNTNLLQQVLGASAWRLRIPRRFVEILNHLGAVSSYNLTIEVVKALGKDGVQLARVDAADIDMAKLVDYDNNNWLQTVHEAVEGRISVQHDQVSGVLVTLNLPPGACAKDIFSVTKFDASKGNRCLLPGPTSFAQLLPSNDDRRIMRDNYIIHVASILAEHCPQLDKFRNGIPPLSDPRAIKPHRTRQFYLPTLDQEQGTVRGNIEVLEEYLFRVLQIPKGRFEEQMMAVLGDRLTTARDRAAQEQRALDHSKARADRFSSLIVLMGLMHTRLALMDVFNRLFWSKGKGQRDPSDLGVLHGLLPHLARVKSQKIDFYAWIRFLEVVLASLVFAAGDVALQAKSSSFEQLAEHLSKRVQSPKQLLELAGQIVDGFMTGSINRMEAERRKKVKGDSHVGHAVIMLQSIIVLRELTHAIKHGHPTRIVRCLKYMYPMFYGGKSYNYAAEIGEFLHNVEHDWPKESVPILVGALLVNSTGQPDGFKETDLGGEHYNKLIKAKAKGPNMNPKVLGEISPALGWLGELNEKLFTELDAEYQYTRHSKVKITKDVRSLVNHLLSHSAFDLRTDRPSDSKIPDLYTYGCNLLASGGHQRHLERYQMAARTRETVTNPSGQGEPQTEDGPEAESADSSRIDYELGDSSDEESDYETSDRAEC